MSLRSERHSDRYKVSVVAKDDKKSLRRIETKFQKIRRKTGTIFTRVTSTFLIAMIAFLGLIGMATPAQAWNPVNDIRDVICSAGNYNYKVETITQTTGTANPKDPNATGYEKFGNAGLTYTSWLGPQDQEGFDDDGTTGGKSILGQAGGPDLNGGIDKWGDNSEESQFPSFYNVQGTCIPVVNYIGNGMANLGLDVAKFFTYIANVSFQLALEESSSVTGTFTPILSTLIEALKDAIYAEFVAPVIMIAALYLGYVGLVKRKTTQFVRDAIWVPGALALAGLLMYVPMAVPQLVDKVVSGINQEIMTSINSVSPEPGSSDLCYVQPITIDYQENQGNGGQLGGYVGPSQSEQDQARYTVRLTQCRLWESFVYKPWVEGQFGNNVEMVNGNWPEVGTIGKPLDGTNMDEGVVVAGKTIKGSWPITFLDARVTPDAFTPETVRLDKQRTQLNVSAALLHTDTPNKPFSGVESGKRFWIASSATAASAASALMIIVLSLSMLMLQVLGHIFWVLCPIFLLVGVHPGTGRRIMLGYFQWITSLAVKRILLGIALSIMLLFYQAILAAPFASIVSSMLIIGVTVAGLMYWKPLTNTYGKVQFAGAGAEAGKLGAFGAQGKQNMKSGIAGAVGLVAGGVAMASSGGNPGAGRAAKRLTQNTAGASKDTNGAGDRKKTSQTNHSTSNTAGAGDSKTEHTSSRKDSSSKESKFSGSEDSKTNGAGDRPSESRSSEEAGSSQPNFDKESTSDSRNDGAGERPQSSTEDSEQNQDTYERETGQPEESQQETDGAGDRPQKQEWNSTSVNGEEELSAEEKRRNALKAQKAEIKREKEALISDGYRRKAPIASTTAKALGKVALAKATGQSTTSAIRAGTQSVVDTNNRVAQKNQGIVSQHERQAQIDRKKHEQENKSNPSTVKPIKVPTKEQALAEARKRKTQSPQTSFPERPKVQDPTNTRTPESSDSRKPAETTTNSNSRPTAPATSQSLPAVPSRSSSPASTGTSQPTTAPTGNLNKPVPSNGNDKGTEQKSSPTPVASEKKYVPLPAKPAPEQKPAPVQKPAPQAPTAPSKPELPKVDRTQPRESPKHRATPERKGLPLPNLTRSKSSGSGDRPA